MPDDKIPDRGVARDPVRSVGSAPVSPRAEAESPLSSPTSASKRKLSLFPRSNSQKWLHRAQQKRQQQKLSAWEEVPIDPSKLIIRLVVTGARRLANEESSCNPYAIVSCAGQRQRTHAIKQTYDPEWATTFDFPLDAILGRRRRQIALTHGISITVCSKDRFKSVFLGQCRFSLQDLTALDAPTNNAAWFGLQTSKRRRRQRFGLVRKQSKAQSLEASEDVGEILLKLGLVVRSGVDGSRVDDLEKSWSMVWHRLTALPLSSSSEQPDDLDLDALQLTEDESESSDRGGGASSPRQRDLLLASHPLASEEQPPVSAAAAAATSFAATSAAIAAAPGPVPPAPAPAAAPSRGRRFRRKSKAPLASSATQSMSSSPTASPSPLKKKRRRLRLRRRRQKELIAEFKSDVVGIMFLEICHAKDLPPEKNVTRTSFDMDPFVIVTFGASTFRTRSIRHNLNPVWNEKLFFHVRHNEAKYSLKFAVYDKDKFSGNDLVATQSIPIMQMIEQSNQLQQNQIPLSSTISRSSSSNSSSTATITNANTNANATANANTTRDIDDQMGMHTLPLNMFKHDKWQNKHNPTLTIRAKFMPYVEIRRMFWLALAKTYDIDENGTMSKLEVQAMLESLGSTITEDTLDKFWRHHHKNPANDADEITMDQLAQSLEDFMLNAEVGKRPELDDEEGDLGDDDDDGLDDDEFDDDDEGLVVRSHSVPVAPDNTMLIGDEEDEEEELDATETEDDDLLFTDALESSISEDDDDDDDVDEIDDDMDVEALRDARGIQFGGPGTPVVLSNSLSYNNLQDMSATSSMATSPTSGLRAPMTSAPMSPSLSTPTAASTSLLSSSPKLIQPSPLRHRLNAPMSVSSSSSSAASHHAKHRDASMSSPTPQGPIEEKVIRLKECPICHRPNLSRRGQMDIVTHVATCAANDWTTVDRFLMGNFITEQYAQRKWFVKLVSKVGYGRYVPGKNNANIIVQDRASGQLIEERMSVYIRLGMRLVYKGMKTGVQSKTAKRILGNLTIRQGKRFDSPASVRDIMPFIKFHRLDMTEVLEPVESFKTFNDFFYRKLKPSARPCASRDDQRVIVSAADSRMMAFDTVDQATKIWIKGWDFTLPKLLDDVAYAMNFQGGSLCVFRLSPQDYHRFHIPVDGVITESHHLPGQYYTVNPMAIRTTLDVFGDNARTIVRMDTPEFGKVAIVCIGAMMVGSIVLTAPVGVPVKRTDELGYFKFGGSTLVVIFERDTVQLDPDLLENAQKPLETLVRVGERIGAHKSATDLMLL
ncbi:phosphatidylserine decarboxylase-domain-containing protein [Gongronella butleri]|nr:phosphatidylserine decarboxylase-domain-containing protein [Gongronella butleri]